MVPRTEIRGDVFVHVHVAVIRHTGKYTFANDAQQDATILVYLFLIISSMTPVGSNIGGEYQKL